MYKIFAQGLIAGVLSAMASVIYFNIYQSVLITDFGKIINVGAIIGASFFACMLIALGYFVLLKIKITVLTGWLNILICLLSFASIVGPIGMSLPLDIETPELFMGLVVPMHFFPALSYFAIQPFFTKQSQNDK